MEPTEKLLAFLRVDSAYQPQAVPGRRSFTFLSKRTGIPQLWTWTEAGADMAINLPDRVMEVSHSPSGTYTVVGMDCRGNEKQQLYLLNNDDASVEELAVSPDHFHCVGGWSPCGKRVAWSSNRRDPGCFDLFVQDVETKNIERVYTCDGRLEPIGWHPDGDNLLVSLQETNIDNRLYLIDLKRQTARRLCGDDRPARYRSARLAKDGRGGWLVTDQGRNTMALCRFSLADGALETLVHVPRWDIVEAMPSVDEQHLAFTVNEGGIFALCLYSVTEKSFQRVEGLPAGVVDSLSWLDPDTLIFCLKSPTLPGDVWRYTVSRQELCRLTFFGRAEQIEHLWKEPKICTYRSFDGLDVPYFFYGDEADSRGRPVVVYVHGGPESQIRAEFHPVLQYLASEGFIVVAPNVRGSMGYGREYVQLDDGRKRMNAVADLAWLVRDLAALPAVDPTRIGIMGRSYGGFMVLAALTRYPDLWAAGVDIVGISDFRSFLANTGPWRRKLREAEYGSLSDHADFFAEIAPLRHAHKIRVPLLVFHGRNDTRVPVSEAEQLVADMKSRQQHVELVVFEDEGHQTEKLENHMAMNRRIAQFFGQHLRQAWINAKEG